MSLKENIDMVKEELNSEEKFFEKAVLTERFVKKYKKAIISSVLAVVVLVGVNVITDINNQNRIEKANKILLKLQNGDKSDALKIELKSLSPNLYNAWLYSVSVKNADAKSLENIAKSGTFIVNDLADYETIQLSPSIAKLDEYVNKNGAIYEDIALVESAVLLLKENKVKQAHQKLSLISTDSKMYEIANALLHYGLK